MKMILSCCMFAMLLFLILPFQAVAAVSITAPPLITDAGVDTPYTYSFIASGGTTPYTWKGTGILPPGLSLSTGGVLSGTPTSSGSYDFTVTVTDSATPTKATGFKQIFMNVTSMPVAMPSSHPNEYGNCTQCHGAKDLPPVTAISGKPSLYSYETAPLFTFSANETATFECSLDGALMTTCVSPKSFTGLALGSHIFRVRATDSTGNVEFPPATYKWDILVPSAIIITTDSTFPPATIGAQYSLTLEAQYGNHNVSYKEWKAGYYLNDTYNPSNYTSTPLPNGLSLDKETGIISGAPTAASGTYNFTLTLVEMDVNDPTIRCIRKAFTITISDHPNLTITTASLASGTEGENYSQSVAATGGVLGYTWSIVADPDGLPQGLTLNSVTGAISGVPWGFSAGTYHFDIRLTDAHAHVATKSFSIVINPAITITTSTLAPAIVGTPYSQSFDVLYGTPPFTWAKNGTLPDGLSLNPATGVISGTPTKPVDGKLPITFSDISLLVTDANGKTANKTFFDGILLSDHAPLAISTASFPSGNVGIIYSQTAVAAGGVPAYTWSIYSGGLPAGMTLNQATGAISGDPTAAGTYAFQLRVTDTHRHYVDKDLSITVYPPMTISTASPLTAGVVGSSYSQTLTAAYGVTPFTWTHSGGTLPPGLTFNAGVISGSPTTDGAYDISVTVNDSGSQSQSANKTFSIVINRALSVTTASLPSGTVGTPYNQTAAASGGVVPYTWTHSSGTLPPGLTFNAGVISGSPTTAGSYAFTLTVNDSGAQSASKPLSIVVSAAASSTPPITVPGLPGNYSSVTEAYAAVPANGTINIAAGSLTLTENLVFNRSISFSLKGGYDSNSGTNPGTSTIPGTLTVRSGALTIENIVIK